MLSVEEVAALAARLPPMRRVQAVAAIQQLYPSALEEKQEALSFREFVTRVNPRFQWYRHCIQLGNVLERVASGEIKRLMIFQPPRTGKSELVSRLFSAYFLRKYPQRWTAITSYAADLAYDLSRAARRNYRGLGEISGEAAAVKHWETGRGGGLWATGVGGPATGKGFHLGIIDDPIKNAEEAASEKIQKSQQDWYRSVFYTRAEPDAAIVLMMTRWNEADLAGYLLTEELGEEPESWHIVSMPSIAEDASKLPKDKRPSFPASCTVERDWRPIGEALVPERYPKDKLSKIEKRIGPYFWNALHMQRPGPPEGSRFKWDWFQIVDALPVKGRRFLAYWDTAGTEDAGDNTSGTLGCMDESGYFYVVDNVAGQWSPHRKDLEIRAACDAWAEHYGLTHVWLEREAGVGGKDRTQSTVRALRGFNVQVESVTGSKADRADPLRAQCEVGNVKILRGPWNHAFLKEITAFPNAAHDDRVDSTAGCFNKLAQPEEVQVVSVSSSYSLIGV